MYVNNNHEKSKQKKKKTNEMFFSNLIFFPFIYIFCIFSLFSSIQTFQKSGIIEDVIKYLFLKFYYHEGKW